ncbi:MAG: phage terminase large subunit family protein [Acidobacteria bacterium]|nr:phage terminase large subunit family protein [Acidobacteriota bacterium]
MITATELRQRIARHWAPPGTMSGSAWADKFMVLSPETSAQWGQWRTRSYQRQPLDAISDPAVRTIVIDAAVQMLKSSVQLIAIARTIDMNPMPIMLLLPRKQDAQEFVDDHLTPLVRDCERLHSKIKLTRNGKAARRFRGGRIVVTSAGSAMNVGGKAIGLLLCDEVDKMVKDVDEEGNPLSLAEQRQSTFGPRARTIYSCSPTLPGSAIDRLYEGSDQREFHIPCPLCGKSQSLKGRFFSHVRYDESLPTIQEQALTARLYCQHCEQPWDDSMRRAAVERGEFRTAKPFNGVVGFWINQLYSLDKRISDIVLEYLKKKDNPSDLKVFVNTVLAENQTDQAISPEWRTLLDRCEDYPIGIIPVGALVLTAGTDVHPDRIEVEVVGWGPARESWSIEYHIFEGDTSDLVGHGMSNPWRKLEALLAEVYPCEGGGEMTISLLAIDSGNQTNDVYQWARLQQPTSRIMVIKGSHSGPNVSQPKPVEVKANGKYSKIGITFRMVNVSNFKEELVRDLKQIAPTKEELAKGWRMPTGLCHFPKGANYQDEHFKQLCAEQLVTIKTRRGQVRQEWQPVRARNEALDCHLYARAAAWALGVDTFDKRPHKWRDLAMRRNPQGVFELATSPAALLRAVMPPVADAVPSRSATNRPLSGVAAIVEAFGGAAVQMENPWL